MDGKLKDILMQYWAFGEVPIEDASKCIAQIKQTFVESFKDAYVKHYNLENQVLSANDEAIFKIVEEL